MKKWNVFIKYLLTEYNKIALKNNFFLDHSYWVFFSFVLSNKWKVTKIYNNKIIVFIKSILIIMKRINYKSVKEKENS